MYLWPASLLERLLRERDGTLGAATTPTTTPRGLRSDTEVIARARRALAGGPLDDAALLGQVLSLPGAPPLVAARIAESLFGRHEWFVRLAGGRWELREEAPAPEQATMLTDVTFAVVDVETTGGGTTRGHRITEFASVRVRAGEVGEPWTTLVNPLRPIPTQVMVLTGITPRMVAAAPTFSDVAPQVVSQLKGSVFAAHNATFDWGFVTREVAAATGGTMDGDRLCTLRLARVLLPQLKRRSLDALSYYFGVDNPARHRAWGDALATARILSRLLGIAADLGLDSWSALSARLDRRTARARKKRRAMPRPVDYDISA